MRKLPLYSCLKYYNKYMTINEFKEACLAIEQEYKTKIAAAQGSAEVEDLRVAALGRKGALTELLKGLKDFSIEEKKEAGPLGNALKISPIPEFSSSLNSTS